MSQPLPIAPIPAGASADVDRDARIEELLLSGLDAYFAGYYEQAITIWTRVAFLERGHGRARAYIERARGAQAERDRESEELLNGGIAAYHAGDIARARSLLTTAIERGGPSDAALAFLQRLNRADVAATVPQPAVPVAPLPTAPVRRRPRWPATIAACVVLAPAIVLAGRPVASWIAEWQMGAPVAVAPAHAMPLPIVRTSEVWLSRARALHAAGQSREAAALLGRIDAADPLRPDADALLALVQRAILATVPGTADAGGGR